MSRRETPSLILGRAFGPSIEPRTRSGASRLLWAAATVFFLAGAAFAATPKETEPAVSKNEAALLKDAATLAETDRAAAIEKLKTGMNNQYSAALDFAMGVFLSQDSNYEDAEKAFARAAEKSPSFHRAWASLGRIRLSLDRPRAASEALRRALETRPDDTDLTKLLGYSYLLSGRLAAAEAAYRKLLVTAPDDREVVLGLAKALLANERYRDALPLLEGECRRNPLDAELWTLRANAHLALEEDDRALTLLECAHRLGTADAQTLLALGTLYYNKGLYASAVSFYDLASSKGTLPAAQMLQCAEALLMADRTDDAVRYLAQAKKAGLARPVRAYLLEGQIAQLRRDTNAARAAFEKAVEADPLNGDALVALGELYRTDGKYEHAVLQFERASRVKGFEARALVLLAQLEVEIDRFDDAVKHLEAAQEMRPDRNVQHYLEQVRNLARY